MGGEAWMFFAKGEVTKVRKWLNTVAGQGSRNEYFSLGTTMPWLSYPNWIHPMLRGRKLEVAYNFGSESQPFADALCAEICKKFKVEKFGWDSTGWCEFNYDPTKLKPYAFELRFLNRKLIKRRSDILSNRKHLQKLAKQIVATKAKRGTEVGHWLVNESN